MKYGLLVNKYCRNLGDDVQSYAEAHFLPRVDYLVDREEIDSFKSKDDERVAVILGAWWSGRKWNFPPPNCIYPLLTAIHVNLERLQVYGGHPGRSPIRDEWLSGVGGEYFKQYGPVGARDIKTMEAFERYGIPAYFSGCVTLTLPEQRRIKPKNEYICLVDVAPEVEKKIQEDLKDSGVDIRVMTHFRPTARTEAEASDWEFRKKEVEELLTAYQNAKCVVTRRLHVSLPCLAMGVPVLCVFPDKSRTDRLEPYIDWLHFVRVKNFISGKFDYDLLNPKPNKEVYIETREKLAKQMRDFVEEVKNLENPPVITTYTEEEKILWQNQLMKKALKEWQPLSKKMHQELAKYEKKRIKRAEMKKGQAKSKPKAEQPKSKPQIKQPKGKPKTKVYKNARRSVGKVLRKLGVKKG
ncbi:MAG: polysaccharide pyruvyl transferase family protein [Coriobacteriia bacterium]|nr:polysaccharide pyruvyl transferase family protein [Coriobacteriia bacterium]